MTHQIVVSPSQHERWEGCPRKWAYSKIVKPPPNPKADWGKVFHDIMERWGKHGTPPDPRTPQGEAALSGLHLVPLPGDGECELEIKPVIAGVTYHMQVDRLYAFTPRASVVVLDYKTTGDFMYMKLPGGEGDKNFEADPQRVIYAHWAAQALDVESVTAYWLYFRRPTKAQPSEARPSVLTEDRHAIAARFWERHARVSLPIVQATELLYSYRRPDRSYAPEVVRELDRFPRNYGHCSAFGKCPYLAHCHQGAPPPPL